MIRNLSLLVILVLGVSFVGCKTQKAATADGAAREDIVEFTCVGNEPFWNIEIATSGIVYTSMGEDPVVYPYNSPEKRGAYTIYTSKHKKSTIKITIIEKTCNDTMSDERFSYITKVELDGKKLSGCAR